MAERQIMQENPPKAKPPKDMANNMSFLEHLEELRWRLIKGLAGISVGIIVTVIFSDFVIDELLLGPTRADFFMYDLIGVEANDLALQSRRLPGQFFAYWGAVFITGAIAGSPIFFYQMWQFIEPALEITEKKSAFFNSVFISFFFFLGVSFGYLILVPFALQFFTSFTISDVVRNDFDINAYFSSVSLWVITCGIIFQVPVISYFLAKLDLITPKFMRQYRKHSIVLALVLAAFLTPPDPVSQIMIAVPLLLLYELSIWIAKLGNRQYQKNLEKAFAGDEL